MSDDRLIAAYRELLSRRVPADRVACVSPERLLGLVQRQLPEADRLRTLDHAMACALCLQDFELLRSVEPGGREAGAPWISGRAVALAASLALLAGAAVLWQVMRGRYQPDVLRGGETQVTLVAPLGTASPADARRLVWRAVAGAAGYQVEVMDSDGAVIYAAATGDTVLMVPGSVSLTSGLEYRWWVRARLPDGTERRATPRSFVIRR